MKKTDPPVVVEHLVSARPTRVWQALTVRDVMVQWYFDNIPVFEPEVGFETSFPVVSGDRTFTHLWKILEVDPGRHITYSWKFLEYPGDGFVRFDIIPEGEATRVKVTNTVTVDFPDDIPEFKRESCQAGWEYFIGERLKQHFAVSN